MATTIGANGLTLPQFTSDPASPVAGQMYYNTSSKVIKHWDGAAWNQMSNKFTASGGNSEGDSAGYHYHVFTSSANFLVDGTGQIEYAIVAGGGGGGYGNTNEGGGGGGAGGMITGTMTVSPGLYSIVVGAGGTKTNTTSNGTNGGNSSAFGITALGGGGGGYCSSGGSSGGSGGGGSGCGTDHPGGAGTSGQGNAGGKGAWTGGGGYGTSGNGGGGGGKSAAGVYGELRTASTRGGEGAGLTLNWTGSNIEYARGGLGGAGRSNYLPPDVAGGTGQGGIGGSTQIGGNGGSGVVLIRWLL